MAELTPDRDRRVCCSPRRSQLLRAERQGRLLHPGIRQLRLRRRQRATTTTDVREVVRERYAAAARVAAGTSEWRCGCASARPMSAARRSSAPRCMTRTGRMRRTRRSAHRWAAASRPPSPTCSDGETVLDLGSGAGADVLISARRVAPDGTRSDST